MPLRWDLDIVTSAILLFLFLVKVDAVDVGFDEHGPQLGDDVEGQGEPDGRHGRQPLQGKPHPDTLSANTRRLFFFRFDDVDDATKTNH